MRSIASDDRAEDGKSWRQVLLDYHRAPGENPLRLVPAYRLYDVNVYQRLAECFGLRNLYILSAGWGFIRADFLTPYYDITFSKAQNVQPYKRREKSDRYADFCMLSDDADKDIVFLGGKDYLPLFCDLTKAVSGRRTVFYNSSIVPKLDGCTLRLFETTTLTNWHYECARAIIDGSISL